MRSRFSNLGVFLLSSAVIGAVSRDQRMLPLDLDEPIRMPDLTPRPLPKQEAKSWLKSQITQADVDAMDRAEAKRARKAAKLRRDHERDH